MRPLNKSQAASCETAGGGVCKCRCGGVFHGSHRQAGNGGAEYFETLPEDDPHKVLSDAERKALRRRRRQDARSARMGTQPIPGLI